MRPLVVEIVKLVSKTYIKSCLASILIANLDALILKLHTDVRKKHGLVAVLRFVGAAWIIQRNEIMDLLAWVVGNILRWKDCRSSMAFESCSGNCVKYLTANCCELFVRNSKVDANLCELGFFAILLKFIQLWSRKKEIVWNVSIACKFYFHDFLQFWTTQKSPKGFNRNLRVWRHNLIAVSV